MEKKIFPHLPLLNNDDDQIKCGNLKNFVIFQYFFFLYPLCGRCRRRFLLHTSNIIIKYILPFLFSFFFCFIVSGVFHFFEIMSIILCWQIIHSFSVFLFLCVYQIYSVSFFLFYAFKATSLKWCVCVCVHVCFCWKHDPNHFFFGYQNIIIIIIRLLL